MWVKRAIKQNMRVREGRETAANTFDTHSLKVCTSWSSSFSKSKKNVDNESIHQHQINLSLFAAVVVSYTRIPCALCAVPRSKRSTSAIIKQRKRKQSKEAMIDSLHSCLFIYFEVCLFSSFNTLNLKQKHIQGIFSIIDCQ